jgi:glycosyltransferase involved in cell wall biosynthesis
LIYSGVIEIHRNPCNMGRANSVNQIFESLDADYFILQDADDLAKPERVARQVAFMDENPDVGCSSSFVDYISAVGSHVAKGKLDLLDDARLAEYLAGDEPFGLFCPAVILRASVVKDPELRFRGQFWPADDIDLWNRIAEKGFKVRAQSENLVGYRIHGQSAVTAGFTRTRMQYEWLRSCLRARRVGKPEPTKDEFLAVWNAAPWWRRINRHRKIVAKGYYRSAGFAAAEKHYLSAAYKYSIAVFLQPGYSLRRAAIQLRGRLFQ